MLGGPKSGLAALTSTPGEAAAFAAAPIFSVIERVVFGLTTWMRIGSLTGYGSFETPVTRFLSTRVTAFAPTVPHAEEQRDALRLEACGLAPFLYNPLNVAAEIEVLDAFVLDEVGGGAGERDRAGGQRVGAI